MRSSKVIAENFRTLRKLAGLSQASAAKKAGISIRYISRVENEAPNITLDALDRLAKGIDCPVSQLVKERKLSNAEYKAFKRVYNKIDKAISLLQDYDVKGALKLLQSVRRNMK